jgi:hypothetical protein
MRLAARELQAAVLQKSTGGQAADRHTVGLRMKGRIDEKTLAEISRLLDRLESLIRQANRNEGGDLYSLTIALAPTEDRYRGEES